MSIGGGRTFIYTLLMVFVLMTVGSVVVISHHDSVRFSGRKTFDAASLSHYSGVDADKPIYLALDGYVYDVTAGKEFYQIGGPYHFLAGRDATSELHLAGAEIIRRKYPIIATYIQ